MTFIPIPRDDCSAAHFASMPHVFAPKRPWRCRWAAIFLGVATALGCHAATVLDDTFADGMRNNQNLPTDAAWYVSSSSSWVTATNAMTLTMSSTAILGVSYFGANSSSPVHLNVGDTLAVTVKFTFNNVAAQNGSQGFRMGVYDFADSTQSPKWATADLSGNSVQGGGVQGYSVFQNFGVTFNNSSPMDVRVRTNLTSTSLLGTSSDHKSLVTGPGNTSNFPGFTNSGQYSLQFSLFRTNSTDMFVTMTWQNLSGGATLSTSAMDTNATTFNFDGIGFRPSSAASSAATITFNEVLVDLTSAGSPPSISFSPVDVSAYTGQSAFFSVVSDGSAPLSYQWYFNTNTPLPDATNSSLTLTNLQTTNSGAYFVIVTNSFGSDTSEVAQLTVTVPGEPTILTDPQSLTVQPGASATFNVSAGGSTPLSYQWYFNTNTPIVGANNSSLTINNVQTTNAGTYSVVVNNLAGSATSSNAVLTINTNPVAPSFVTQPASVIVLAGGNAGFSAAASGTAPIYYQWLKNGSPISGATATTLNFTNVQNSDSGTYSLAASNSVGTAASSNATLTVTTSVTLPDTAYNLTGFAAGTTGGGVIADTDPAYRKVYTALDLANALVSAYKTAGSVKVIEIMNDLDLGWNEIGSAVQTLASTPFRSHNAPLLHPRLLVTGVSLIDIKPRSGLTIFSANGATVRHATFNIKSAANIIVRNLKFDEMWEWDEASKGQYDKNDWDFIDLGNGGSVSNIWVDHCTFTKSYDGILDTKAGSSAITISWCKYTGDDGATNTNSWVRQQISSLESNRTSYAFYNFLRNNGFSTGDIITIIQGHDKTHLSGANDLDPNNATLSMTFHHLWLNSVWDRCVPRLRAGNVHDYNIYADDTSVLAAKNLRNARAAVMSAASQNTLNNTYSFNPPINGSISTENGALLVEKSVYIDCLTPLRNNQTDPSNPAYTGKILALDTIYKMNLAFFRGNSTDPGGTNTLGPVQAPVIPFSWNLPGNQLPYTCSMDDPSQLPAIVAVGAGAGAVTWAKTNWLLTTYAPTAPVILAQPQNQTVTPSNSVSFTVVVSGSAPLAYRWYLNTNTPIANATNSTLTLGNVQPTNAGAYSVVVTNVAGSIASTNVFLTVSAGASAPPQLSNSVFSNGVFSLTINGDSGPEYIVQASTNLTDWTGIFTNHSPIPPFVWSDSNTSNFDRRFYRIQLGP
jgi:pectate lyase